MAIASGVQVKVVLTGSPSDPAFLYGRPASSGSGSASAVLWWQQGYVVQGRPAETRGDSGPVRRGRAQPSEFRLDVWPRK